MSTALDTNALNQLFFNARTVNAFTEQALTDTQIHALYDTARWAPTAFNAQPARWVFVTTPEGKDKLIPTLMEGNQAKTRQAPLTVIVAWDTNFQEHLPTQFPAMDVKGLFDGNAELTHTTAFRNSSMQAAYLIMAARAMGLDVGAMSGFDPAAVNAAFFPDGRFHANMMLNIGYGVAESAYPRGPRLSFDEAVTVA